MSSTPSADTPSAATPTDDDQGPGCMPAILAAAVLMGIVGFVFCGFMSWLIFQKQDVLALRAMRGSYIPAVEQSLLAPEEKSKTVEMLDEFADELERGRLEGWQASGVLQRLNRLPVLEWGQMRRVEAFVDSHPDDFADDASVQFDRLRKGVEQNDVTSLDFRDILTAVLQSVPNSDQPELVETLSVDAVQDVVERARLVADRSNVPDNPKSDVGIDTLVRRQIEAGIKQGTY